VSFSISPTSSSRRSSRVRSPPFGRARPPPAACAGAHRTFGLSSSMTSVFQRHACQRSQKLAQVHRPVCQGRGQPAVRMDQSDEASRPSCGSQAGRRVRPRRTARRDPSATSTIAQHEVDAGGGLRGGSRCRSADRPARRARLRQDLHVTEVEMAQIVATQPRRLVALGDFEPHHPWLNDHLDVAVLAVELGAG
jgi:hypothetical protein